MSIIEIGSFAVGSGLISTSVAYLLFQQLLKIQVSKVVDQHKASLDRQTEKLKSELSIYAHENTIALTRLEAERADAVKQLHSLTIEGNRIVGIATKMDLTTVGSPTQQINAFLTAVTDLPTFAIKWHAKFTESSIYFDDPSSAALLKYPTYLSDVSIEVSNALQEWKTLDLQALDHRQAELLGVLQQQQQRIAKVASTEGISVRRLLLTEFRRHLRVGSRYQATADVDP